MLKSLPLIHDSCKKCPVFFHQTLAFGCRSVRYSLHLELELLPSSAACRGVGTGCFREVFFHLCRSQIPETALKRGAKTKRVEDLTEWIVRMDADPVAHGGFSDVWRCQLRYGYPLPNKVAVKAIRPMIANDDEFRTKEKAVEQELRVWVQLDHPNVLPLCGITQGFGPFSAFVCPWEDHGTLSEYLEKFEKQLDFKKRMVLLRDIAAGLQYLHARRVVHGDLSGSNVLITEDGRARLSDFGLSTLLDTAVSDISFPGHIRWAAPELFVECESGRSASQLASREADIYSFGNIMLQILTGKVPWCGIERLAQIVITAARGGRPAREPRWDGRAIPDALWEFMETCWVRPSGRPSCNEVVAFIARQLSRL